MDFTTLSTSFESVKRKVMNSSFEPGTEAKAPLLITDTGLSITATETHNIELVAHPTLPPTLTTVQLHPVPHNQPQQPTVTNPDLSVNNRILSIVETMQASLTRVETNLTDIRDQVRKLTVSQQRIDGEIVSQGARLEEIDVRLDGNDQKMSELEGVIKELKNQGEKAPHPHNHTHNHTQPTEPFEQIKNHIKQTEVQEVEKQVRLGVRGKMKREGKNEVGFMSEQDKQYPYYYGGIAHWPVEYNPYIRGMSGEASRTLGCSFNNTQVIIYGPDGELNFHLDDEQELVPGSLIAMQSLGGDRLMMFKHKVTGETHEVELKSGDLTIITQASQDTWLHAITKPKEGPSEERVALVYRMLRPLNNTPRVHLIGDSNCKDLKFTAQPNDADQVILSSKITGTNTYTPRLNSKPAVGGAGEYTDIILQTGTNEIRQSDVSPSQLFNQVQDYTNSILQQWPGVNVHVVGVIPSKNNTTNNKILHVNHMYAEWIRKADTRRLTYIDTSFLGEPGTGTLKPRLTSKNTHDSLPDYHMSQDGKRMLYNCFKQRLFKVHNITPPMPRMGRRKPQGRPNTQNR